MKNKITLYSMILIIVETVCMFIPFCFLQKSWMYDSNSFVYHGSATLKYKENVNIFGVSTALGTVLAVILVIFMLLSFGALLYCFIKNETKLAKYFYFAPLVSFLILMFFTIYVAAFAKDDSVYWCDEWNLNWLIFVIIALHIITVLLCMVLRFNLFKRFTSKNFGSGETLKKNEAVSNADELKKYKELLDTGVITQEEFDAKKKQILGL